MGSCWREFRSLPPMRAPLRKIIAVANRDLVVAAACRTPRVSVLVTALLLCGTPPPPQPHQSKWPSPPSSSPPASQLPPPPSPRSSPPLPLPHLPQLDTPVAPRAPARTGTPPRLVPPYPSLPRPAQRRGGGVGRHIRCSPRCTAALGAHRMGAACSASETLRSLAVRPRSTTHPLPGVVVQTHVKGVWSGCSRGGCGGGGGGDDDGVLASPAAALPGASRGRDHLCKRWRCG